MELKGLSVAITGGASGLGLATARRVIDAGGLVTLIDLPTSDGQAVAGAVGVAITPTGGTSAITGASFGAATGGQFYAEQ